MELQWPVDICEACGFNLREATPKENEKSNDKNGKLKWTDFCPKCGHGYFVGDRVLPAPISEVLAELEAAPVLKGQEKPEEDNIDPERQLGKEPEAPPEEKPEPGTIKPPGKGQYFCTKCAFNHSETSGIGKKHSKKYREA